MSSSGGFTFNKASAMEQNSIPTDEDFITKLRDTYGEVDILEDLYDNIDMPKALRNASCLTLLRKSNSMSQLQKKMQWLAREGAKREQEEESDINI